MMIHLPNASANADKAAYFFESRRLPGDKQPITHKADLMYFIEDESNSIQSFARSLVGCELLHDKCSVLLCGNYDARVIEQLASTLLSTTTDSDVCELMRIHRNLNLKLDGASLELIDSNKLRTLSQIGAMFSQFNFGRNSRLQATYV